MDEDTFNISLRKFLKTVGVTSQREIEKAVREAAAAGSLPAGKLVVTARITIEGLPCDHVVRGDIDPG